MTKFGSSSDAGVPPVSKASLPDIVFMFLFFFMTVTVMKDTSIKVENELPNSSEVKKMEQKDRIIYIDVGKPMAKYQREFGIEPRIQLNDKYALVDEEGPYVLAELAKRPEHLSKYITVSLKVDRHASMGLIADIKLELRKVNALKINYTTF
ncbi:MAG: biopolymer transporter ExbD [Flavobacteriaceae bacterium]